MPSWFLAVGIWIVALIYFIGTMTMIAEAYAYYTKSGKKVPLLSMWLIIRSFVISALIFLGIWVAPL